MKTAFTGALICLVCGIAAVLYGTFGYSNVVDLGDVVTGATAEIISVEKVERNLSINDKKREEEVS